MKEPEGRSQAERLCGVYLLTPDVDASDFSRVLHVVEDALSEGVTVVQYRNKRAVGKVRLHEARELVTLVHAAGALAIVNDDVELAVDVGADGVHLGDGDGDPAKARRRLHDRLLGVSCYNELERAARAIKDGADAVAFGAMYASATKPAAAIAPINLLGTARRLDSGCRVIAIGGIDASNIAQVASAGAHAAALIAAVFGAPQPRAAVRDLIDQFSLGRARDD